MGKLIQMINPVPTLLFILFDDKNNYTWLYFITKGCRVSGILPIYINLGQKNAETGRIFIKWNYTLISELYAERINLLCHTLCLYSSSVPSHPVSYSEMKNHHCCCFVLQGSFAVCWTKSMESATYIRGKIFLWLQGRGRVTRCTLDKNCVAVSIISCNICTIWQYYPLLNP